MAYYLMYPLKHLLIPNFLVSSRLFARTTVPCQRDTPSECELSSPGVNPYIEGAKLYYWTGTVGQRAVRHSYNNTRPPTGCLTLYSHGVFPTTPIPQNSIQSSLSPFDDGNTQSSEPIYQKNSYFIASAVAVILLISCGVCALRRSHRPLSNFFVRRRGSGALLGGQQPPGTPYRPYSTMSIGMQHRSVAMD
ncbi:hypothetical protein EDD16DRAFT_243836 [Pisolithus croceorrhizus]|nr:hypothetical protein EDD16DRAFT_243836 [Pisolithus croceorrhizus]KAI6113298.1 hypothetical protein EV401DRAFT_193721 [Pisolithus croceorrhizus]